MAELLEFPYSRIMIVRPSFSIGNRRHSDFVLISGAVSFFLPNARDIFSWPGP